MKIAPRHVGAGLACALVLVWSGATLAQASQDPNVSALASAIVAATGTNTPLISLIVVVGAWLIVRELRGMVKEGTAFLAGWKPVLTLRTIHETRDDHDDTGSHAFRRTRREPDSDPLDP